MNGPALEKPRALSRAGAAAPGAVAGTGAIAAGLQKTSLIDFPGRVSCVVFLAGCNFTCPYCHNPDLALGRLPRQISLDQLNSFLEERRTFLDGVVISGGEPTLDPGLAGLCRSIQSLGLAVKLDTNGSRPEVLDTLMREGLLDYIAMDLKTAPARYGSPLCPGDAGQAVRQSIRQSIRTIMEGGCDYEFRTTCLKPFVDEDGIGQMAAAIKGARRYILQRFRPDTVLSPGYFSKIDPVFSEDELTHLQRIASPWVERCLVR